MIEENFHHGNFGVTMDTIFQRVNSEARDKDACFDRLRRKFARLVLLG